MKKSLAALVFVFLTACGGGGGGGTAPPPPPPPPPPDPTAIEQFTADIQGLTLTDFYQVSFGGLLNRTPESVVTLGLEAVYPTPLARINDLSESYQDDTYTMYQIALDKLATYDRTALSPEEQLNYDVYDWYLNDKLAEEEFALYAFPATYSGFGVPGGTSRFFEDLHPVITATDAQNWLDRISTFDTKFAQLEAHLQRQQTAGIVEPALSMQVAINQIDAILATPPIDLAMNQAYRDKVATVPGLSTTQRARFRDLALASMLRDVVPAYQRLRSTLANLIGSAPGTIGVAQYPRGDEYYTYMLQHRTTSSLTAAEIHQLGLDELVRIHAEMRVIFDQLGYPQNETLEELYVRVDTDAGTVLAADSFATFENLVAFAESNLPQAFDIFPQADVVVLPDPSGGFYIGPSLDGTRPGAFYAGTDFDQPYTTMPTLTFHEALPGHHMQIAIGAEANVPLFRKVVRSTGFTEGWALYAERLAFELGWYDNDVYGNLGRLQFEALRAARLVIDTGIHDLGWTFDEAVQFNQDNVGSSLQTSQSAVARYSVIPAQATAYMVGMLQILSERQRAMDALGANFSLIGFHRALLTNGAVPLTLLPTVVDRYIADAQSP
jgi:uncharacterized protein (DUF885 family)